VEGRLDAIRAENAAKLDEMRQTVDEKLQTALEKRLGESFRTVSEQLDRVHNGLGEMQKLAVGVGDLKRVLSNVKVRGTLGEGQLGTLLDQYLAPDQFLKNAQIKDHTGERVDFAIRLPSGAGDAPVLVPVDAKFPTEDYERLVTAADGADTDGIAEASVALEKTIRQCAKSICEKYIFPPVTTDFAILFVPTEGLFAEILRRPGLYDSIQREHRVMIAGPTTLSAMLSAFQMGFRSQAIRERSMEVWKVLGAVRTEFSEHGKVVAKLQKQLGAASNTIDKLGTRTKAMNRKLKEVEALPASDAKALLELDDDGDTEQTGSDSEDEIA
jgi:DNA recombination protein RmuC